MKKALTLVLACALILSIGLTGCASSTISTSSSAASSSTAVSSSSAVSSSTAASSGSTASSSAGKIVIKIGCPQPLSGGQSDSGLLGKCGIEAALEYWNKQGGFKNHPNYEVQIVYADTESDANVAATQAEKLISSEKIDVMLGGYSSGLVAAMAPLAIKYECPYLLFPGVANSITS